MRNTITAILLSLTLLGCATPAPRKDESWKRQFIICLQFYPPHTCEHMWAPPEALHQDVDCTYVKGSH